MRKWNKLKPPSCEGQKLPPAAHQKKSTSPRTPSSMLARPPILLTEKILHHLDKQNFECAFVWLGSPPCPLLFNIVGKSGRHAGRLVHERFAPAFSHMHIALNIKAGAAGGKSDNTERNLVEVVQDFLHPPNQHDFKKRLEVPSGLTSRVRP